MNTHRTFTDNLRNRLSSRVQNRGVLVGKIDGGVEYGLDRQKPITQSTDGLLEAPFALAVERSQIGRRSGNKEIPQLVHLAGTDLRIQQRSEGEFPALRFTSTQIDKESFKSSDDRLGSV